MAELNVLLLNWQVEALESVAFSRGVTTAHLLRRLIHNCLAGLDGARAPEEPTRRDAEEEGGGTTA